VHTLVDHGGGRMQPHAVSGMPCELYRLLHTTGYAFVVLTLTKSI